MTRTAIRLELLVPRAISCSSNAPWGKRTWRMLVDTGPDDIFAILGVLTLLNVGKLF